MILEERFWRCVDRSGEHWMWTGGRSGNYGAFYRSGETIKAHRASWEIANGPIPEGLKVRHLCSVARCVDPDHLFLGPAGASNSRPMEDRFWEKVEKRGPDECWPWLGATAYYGYGAFNVGGEHVRGAHRVSWELANGPIPDGMHVLHRCDNPPCVNPAHLFLGTHQDNMDDMQAKGRAFDITSIERPLVHGEHNGHAKLTLEQARAIRDSSEPGKVLAARYGVGQPLISGIRHGTHWAKALEESQ